MQIYVRFSINLANFDILILMLQPLLQPYRFLTVASQLTAFRSASDAVSKSLLTIVYRVNESTE